MARAPLALGTAAAVGIVVVSVIRAVALQAGAPSIPTGATFALAVGLPCLAMPALRARLRGRPAATSVGLGLGLGALLLLPGAWLRATGHHAAGELLPPAILAAWAPAVCLVAAAEEVALRSGVQPWLRQALGPAPAVVLTAGVFALAHYPLYGAAAMPLDLGVGILIGCLREYSGSVAACWLAHSVADIGAWWLP